MENSKKTVIIGGVAGGASAAARLRRLDEQAEIVMLERGEYISFANCGLPYYIGGEIKERSALTLQTPKSFYDRFLIDVRIKNEVMGIDTQKKFVTVKKLDTGEEYKESYDNLVLSLGAEPFKPNIPGLSSDKVFTLRTIPDSDRIKEYIGKAHPESAVVVGGGYVGIEMAENLASLGLKTTIVEGADQILPPLDFDMACDVHRHMEENGVLLKLGALVRGVEDTGLSLIVEIGDEKVTADMLVMAVGVKPETQIANAAGITLNARGSIVVDEHMRTSAPDIYAVGDAVEIIDFVTGEKGFAPLAGPANKQGRVAADNICGIESVYTGTQGSAIIKVFDLTVASTGINEKTAKKLGIDYEKSFTYSPSHAGYYPGAVNMSIKLLFEQSTGKILGAQLVGYDGVDKRCDVLATAIRAGMKVSDLVKLELCYAPPYGSAKDPVNMAGFTAENILTSKVKIFHWHDVQGLLRDGSVTLIDTRTPIEYENGYIEGFINIPLDSLRGRLDEIPKDKTVYVLCQIGLRGYIAARILSQNGYDVYNLSGGYRLYRSIYAPHTPAATNTERRMNTETQLPKTAAKESGNPKSIPLDACGLSCPGPIIKLSAALNDAEEGEIIEISTTDPAFAGDIDGFCRRTGNVLLGMESSKGVSVARIQKGGSVDTSQAQGRGDKKNIIVFSGDLDKAIASFIIANAAAAMGRKVSMFFTFWGLNILRRPNRVKVKKNFISKMFARMMPRGAGKLRLSKMSMGGMGDRMIKSIMKKKNVSSIEELIKMAQDSGVELIACSMSMDLMGISKEELIDGVAYSGAAGMLANAEESDMSLFI